MSKTPESIALKAALAAAKVEQVDIAREFDLEASGVAQWLSGHRPVPPKWAPRLGAMLGVPPERISKKYAEQVEQQRRADELNSDMLSDNDARREITRLQDDVRLLNVALGAMAVAMARHRPKEARDVAGVLLKRLPKQLRAQGVLASMLKTLEEA